MYPVYDIGEVNTGSFTDFDIIIQNKENTLQLTDMPFNKLT